MTIRLGRVELTGGFLLMAAVLYYLDGDGVLPWAFLACVCHELGHYAVIYLTGGQVSRLRLSVAGAEMCLSAKRPMGHGAQLASALAGPGMNLLIAYLAPRLGQLWGESWYLFSGLNLSLAAFNLLPVRQLDGGRALFHLIAMLSSDQTGERFVKWASVLTVGALLGGGALLWFSGSNFTLLLTSGWLALSLGGGTAVRNIRKRTNRHLV